MLQDLDGPRLCKINLTAIAKSQGDTHFNTNSALCCGEVTTRLRVLGAAQISKSGKPNWASLVLVVGCCPKSIPAKHSGSRRCNTFYLMTCCLNWCMRRKENSNKASPLVLELVPALLSAEIRASCSYCSCCVSSWFSWCPSSSSPPQAPPPPSSPCSPSSPSSCSSLLAILYGILACPVHLYPLVLLFSCTLSSLCFFLLLLLYLLFFFSSSSSFSFFFSS